MCSKKKELLLSDIEAQGLDRMRELNQAFLVKNKCSKEVRQFMSEAQSDADLMLLYLKARKYKPDYAWETLKRKAEARFDHYPEVFIKKPASFYEELQKIGLWGLLKSTDRFGRRIICIRCSKWDINVHNITDCTNNLVQLTEKLLLDDKALENGVVFVVDAEGMGFHFARHLGLKVLLRLLNCLWYSCPLKVKGAYVLSLPFYLLFLYELVKPFFPKKLKERFTLTSPSQKFSELHENIDKRILPDYLGGTLEYSDAFEFVKF